MIDCFSFVEEKKVSNPIISTRVQWQGNNFKKCREIKMFFLMFILEECALLFNEVITTHTHKHTDRQTSWIPVLADTRIRIGFWFISFSFNPCIISHVIESDNINNIQINDWREKVSRRLTNQWITRTFCLLVSTNTVDGKAIHLYSETSTFCNEQIRDHLITIYGSLNFWRYFLYTDCC